MSAFTQKNCVAAVLALCGMLGQSALAQDKSVAKQATPESVEVRLSDDSILHVLLREECVGLETPYGKLLIPVKDIRKIDIGLRISREERSKIDAAVVDLGHAEFTRRQTATAELLALKEKAYPSVVAASRSKDPEVAGRAQSIINGICNAVSPETLQVPAYDLVHTYNSQLAGLVVGSSLRVNTMAFGDQQLKLADVRCLRSGRDRVIVMSPPSPAVQVQIQPFALPPPPAVPVPPPGRPLPPAAPVPGLPPR